jgi:hypothetical protein
MFCSHGVERLPHFDAQVECNVCGQCHLWAPSRVAAGRHSRRRLCFACRPVGWLVRHFAGHRLLIPDPMQGRRHLQHCPGAVTLSLTSRPVLRALACLHTTLAALAHARTTPTFTLSQLERFLHSCCCHPSPRGRIFSLVLSAHLLLVLLLCDSINALYFSCDFSQGLTISKETMEAMKLSEAELLQEKADADDIVGGGSA